MIVAGKLYADPEVIKPSALTQAGKAVSTIIYAQTRGDLQRLWTYCLLNGMDYHLTAIPAGVPRGRVERRVQAGGDDRPVRGGPAGDLLRDRLADDPARDGRGPGGIAPGAVGAGA